MRGPNWAQTLATDLSPDVAELFRSHDLLVRRGPAFGGPVCFVTFSHFTHEWTLDRPGFGEAFLASRGLDAIHVLSLTNAWFDYAEIGAALAAAAAATAGFARVITYGSSMGGYAAVRFAGDVGADVAIAISPQYGVGRAAPYDPRFVSDRPSLGRAQLPAAHGSRALKAYVFFDPLDLDARHVARIARSYPGTSPIALPHAGHPTGLYLDEAGVLTEAVVSIAGQTFDPVAFAVLARSRRRGCSQYFFTLARRLGPIHAAAKVSLLRMAIALRDDGTYRLYLAVLLETAGDLDGAQAQLDLAQVVLPDHQVVLYALASFLMRRGRHLEARPLLRELVRRHPENHRFVQNLAVAKAASGCSLAELFAPELPMWLASTAPRRVAWTAWLIVAGLLTRLHAAGYGAALPRWHDRYFNLARERRLIDEWQVRKDRRRSCAREL